MDVIIIFTYVFVFMDVEVTYGRAGFINVCKCVFLGFGSSEASESYLYALHIVSGVMPVSHTEQNSL